MIDLKTAPRLGKLSNQSTQLLAQVDDYALDYNIFLFKGIGNVIDTNDAQLVSFIESLFITLPKEYSSLIYNPLNLPANKINPSTTSKLQKRLLSLLIQERHKRDIQLLNKKFENKIKYVELEEPEKYEIKSIYYRTFDEAKDEYADQFGRLALLQSLEYDFEHALDNDSDYQSDDNLVEHFCDDRMLDFELGKSKSEDEVVNSQIIRVLLPLASQVILGQQGEGEEEGEED
ncbi:hypothetical protein PMKS-000301 [Pichia membranifaciens]|uniref:Uncharacterized protein n=1 Tax=Pichia membranifaciens TaxID=4926 RepID=A0A1Q2YBD3_9ASCO|nr:hypothetical protein PMKS-000301 [Pichia membranifaciens]